MTPDEKTIAQLKRAGSDLKKPHRVDFYLYLPTREKADNVAFELTAERFCVEVERGASGNDWLCLATKEIVPDANTLLSLREMLSKLAADYGGEYDGWETQVLK